MPEDDVESSWSRIASDDVGTVLLQRAPSRALKGRSLLFRKPDYVVEAWRPCEVPGALDMIEAKLAQGFYLAGYVAYEAGFALEPKLFELASDAGEEQPLVWLGCYREPQMREDAFPLADLSSPASGLSLAPLSVRYSHSQESYERNVRAVRDLIAAGETYQLNLTLDASWKLEETPADLYDRLLMVQPVPYAALLHPQADLHIVSLSPELLLERSGDQILTRPMKGTTSPGMDLAESRRRAAWLSESEKERAENVMIVDLMRNDLNRICRTGSVKATKLFEVEHYPTVLQMNSVVEGRLKEDIRYKEIFTALFPSGSIVGAPKIHSMRLLAGLEGRSRGVYTGAIGYIGPHESQFNVAIRTLSIQKKQVRMGVGAGITFDSDPALEWAECMTKAMFLHRKPDPPFELLETVLLREGRYVFLEEHLRRIAQSAEYFDFAFDEGAVRDVLHTIAQSWEDRDRVRVRLLLTKKGKATCTASHMPEGTGGVGGLLLQNENTVAEDRFLRHKTTNRARYDRAFQQAQALGFADSFFLNTKQEVTEGAIHNIVAFIAGEWVTPHVSSGVLPGIYRQHLIDEKGVRERVLTLGDLLKATGIVLCNSVRGMQRVENITVQGHSGQMETIWADQHFPVDIGDLQLRSFKMTEHS